MKITTKQAFLLGAGMASAATGIGVASKALSALSEEKNGAVETLPPASKPSLPAETPAMETSSPVFIPVPFAAKSGNSDIVKRQRPSAIEGLTADAYGRLVEFLKMPCHENEICRANECAAGKITIGVGFNMDAPDAKMNFNKALGQHDDVLFKAVYRQQQDLTPGQINSLLEFSIMKARNAACRQLGLHTHPDGSEREWFVKGKAIFSALNANQQCALISMAFNSPALIGPKLTGFICKGEFDKAANEIMSPALKNETQKSSKQRRLSGLDNRRLREAALFEGNIKAAMQEDITGYLAEKRKTQNRKRREISAVNKFVKRQNRQLRQMGLTPPPLIHSSTLVRADTRHRPLVKRGNYARLLTSLTRGDR
ncbi:MAG: hypothetical protein AB7U41_06415 [Dongiaceae bacterium]